MLVKRTSIKLLMERRIRAFENKCYRRMLGKSYRDHKTNEYVWQQVDIIAGRHKLLLSAVKRLKVSWFSHVCRHDMPPKIMAVVAEEACAIHNMATSRNGQAS